MKKFTFEVHWGTCARVDIEAETETEARDKFQNAVEEGSLSDLGFYDYGPSATHDYEIVALLSEEEV